jgi:type I restriction enzyme, S subunit
MNKHWKRMKLIDVIQKTETINPQKNPDASFEYIDVSSICNKQFRIQETSTILGKDAPSRARKFVRTGDILFATVRPTLKRIAQVPEYLDSQICSTGYFVLRPKDFVEARFLFYFLFTKHFMGAMEQLQKGASYPAVNDSEVSCQTISIPPLSEQKRIVSIVDEAFEAIDIAIDNTKQNLTNARELFDSYLNAIFTQKGDGWEWVTLSEITTDITDGDHQPPPKSESGIPFITISNINKQDRTVDFSNTFKVSSEYFNKLKHNKKPRQGDILYTVTGSYGIPVVVDHALDFCFQRHIGLIRPDLETNSKCLYYMLLSRHLLNQADECATGTAQKTVSLSGLRRFSVPKIPKEQQETIVAELDILSEQICRLEAIYRQKLTALNELKQSILHKAFTGELTADKADLKTNIEPEAIAV